MHFFKTTFGKFVVLASSAFTISLLSFESISATTTDDILTKILENTIVIVAKIDQTPEYLRSWLAPDDSTETANLQTSFTKLNQLSQDIATGQLDNAVQMNQLYLNDQEGLRITDKTYPDANDITFPTLLGKPFFSPDPRDKPNQPQVDSALNYLKNASGMNITHSFPDIERWSGTLSDKIAYKNYFKSAIAAQTLNGYLLSSLYADLKSPSGPFSKLQTELMKTAGDANWFQSIGTADLGIVIRQLLLFQSQSFLLLSQMLVTQKQMLYAQTVSNTLTVLGNMTDEKQYLLKNARTTNPSSNY